MNFTNLFRIAVKALSNNKLRGFLTMLGIIIGVASVITMLAIGQGSKRSIQAEISEMGSNMIMVHPGGDRRGGVQLSADDMQSLKIKDFEDIRADTRYVTYVSPAVNSSGQAVYGANNTPTMRNGMVPKRMTFPTGFSPLVKSSSTTDRPMRHTLAAVLMSCSVNTSPSATL